MFMLQNDALKDLVVFGLTLMTICFACYDYEVLIHPSSNRGFPFERQIIIASSLQLSNLLHIHFMCSPGEIYSLIN